MARCSHEAAGKMACDFYSPQFLFAILDALMCCPRGNGSLREYVSTHENIHSLKTSFLSQFMQVNWPSRIVSICGQVAAGF